jgi:hypothetical protein
MVDYTINQLKPGDVVEILYKGKTYWAKFEGDMMETNCVPETRSYLFLTHKGYRRFRLSEITRLFKYDLFDRVWLWLQGIRFKNPPQSIVDL